MNFIPPTFSFKGNKLNAISLKSHALAFFNHVSKEAERVGVPFISRSKVLNDGSVISISSSKQSNYSNRVGTISIFSPPTPIKKSIRTGLSVVYYELPSDKVYFDIKGCIYINRPSFYAPPESVLYSPVLNGYINPDLVKDTNVYHQFTSLKDKYVLYNGYNNLNYPATGSDATWGERVLTSSHVQKDIPVIATNMAAIVEARYINDTRILIVSSDTNRAVSHIYLDTLDGDVVTNVMDIYYDARLNIFTITIMHNTLGTIVKDYSSQVSSYLQRPKVSSCCISPDGKYLSILISDTSSEYENKFYDLVIRLDSNGVYADPNDGITEYTSYNNTLLDNIESHSNYSDIISNNKSIALYSFKGECGVRSKVESAGDTLSVNIDELTHACGEHYESYQGGTEIIKVLNSGLIRPSSALSDFSSLFVTGTNLSATSFALSYDSSGFIRGGIIDVVYVPTGEPNSFEVYFDRRLFEYASYRGEIKTTYSIKNKGSTPTRNLYTLDKDSNGNYIREWVLTKAEFIDDSNKVTDKVTISKTIKYSRNYINIVNQYYPLAEAPVNNYATYLPTFDPSRVDTVYSDSDVTYLNTLNDGMLKTTTYSDTGIVSYGVFFKNNRVGNIRSKSIILNSSWKTETRLEATRTATTSPPLRPGFPNCYTADLTFPKFNYLLDRQLPTAPTKSEVDISYQSCYDSVYIYPYNEDIKFLNVKTFTNKFNKNELGVINPSYSSYSYLFPNGIYVTNPSNPAIVNSSITLYSSGLESESILYTSPDMTIPGSTYPLINPLGAINGAISFTYSTTPISSSAPVERFLQDYLFNTSHNQSLYFRLNEDNYICYATLDDKINGSRYIVLINGIEQTSLNNINPFSDIPNDSAFNIGFIIPN